MARKLPAKDVVIIGLGWTGSILAHELAKAGLDVVAIERGPWRDTATDFPPAYAQDELRYAVRLDLFLRPDQETLTFRNNASQTALPIRNFSGFLPVMVSAERAFTGTVKRGGFCPLIFSCAVILSNVMARRHCRPT